MPLLRGHGFSKYNRQSLSIGVNYVGSLLVTLPGKKLALCNTGTGGNIECNTTQ